MYTVKLDGKWLFNPELGIYLRTAKLSLSDCAAGSFDFVIEKEHPLYDRINTIVSRVNVYRDETEIWEGRPYKVTDNWVGSRSVSCEGALAYLNDTIQEQAEYHDYSVESWLRTLISNHNAKVDESRQFMIGQVTVEENLYRYTNYETTLDAINDKLLRRLEGHMRVRKYGGYNYIDYLKDYPRASTQTISFGKNLLDYSKNLDLKDIVTVILPLGEKLEDTESEIEALGSYVTVENMPADKMHRSGSIYVQNDIAVRNFGWICKVVHWDNVSEPSNLLTKARNFLTDFQYDDMTLQVKGIDLHMINADVEAFDLLDKVRVISVPHGLNRLFPITKMDIDLCNPANSTLTLGALGLADTSLTTKNNTINAEINEKIDNIQKSSSFDHFRCASLIVGGVNHEYGTISLRDENDNQIGQWTPAHLLDTHLITVRDDVAQETKRIDVDPESIYGYTMENGVQTKSFSLKPDEFHFSSSGSYIAWTAWDDRLQVGGDIMVEGDFKVFGTKDRVVDTADYGERLLYCYETPSPLFGDVGEGTISEDGKCYVFIDGIFAETVTLDQYQVFLQAYGEGECYVSERKPGFFIVEGTPGMKFGWELKAKQSDYDQLRLDKLMDDIAKDTTDYGYEAANYIKHLKEGRLPA